MPINLDISTASVTWLGMNLVEEHTATAAPVASKRGQNLAEILFTFQIPAWCGIMLTFLVELNLCPTYRRKVHWLFKSCSKLSV